MPRLRKVQDSLLIEKGVIITSMMTWHMMSITFCLDVGNDWYFILCNFGGLIMRSFKEREGASGRPHSPSPSPPPPPPLQEEKRSPVLGINALSFWNHSWTQIHSDLFSDLFPVMGEYLPWRIWTYLNRFLNFSVSRLPNFIKFRPITKFIQSHKYCLVIFIFETALFKTNKLHDRVLPSKWATYNHIIVLNSIMIDQTYFHDQPWLSATCLKDVSQILLLA